MDNKSILLVEDDPQLRLVLSHILAREGYDVTEAEDGDIALRKIAEHPYDLVVMDIIMPNKEGIETILELRKTYPDLKIIAMSGGSRSNAYDPLHIAQNCGANFVLSKPFEPSDIRNAVKLCWPQQSG